MRVLFIIVFGVLALMGCDNSAKSGKPSSKRQHAVEVVEAHMQPLSTKRQITGTVEAARTVKIYNQEAGQITALSVHPGDRVSAEDVLITIDDTLIAAEYAKADASYELARLDYQRIKRLRPGKLTSEDEVAKARTALAQAKAERSLLKTRLERTRIKAPFDGIISERLIEQGDIVPLYSHILTLYDPGSLLVKISISEIILNSIDENSAVTIRVDSLGNKLLNGRVLRKYPLADENTRQSVIEVELVAPPATIYPGQLARVSIKGQTPSLLALPLAVIRHDTQGAYVYTVGKDNRAHASRIKTGIQLGQRIQILEGIKPGERVISKGFNQLRDNMAVKVVQQDKSTATQKTNPSPLP